MQTFLPYNDFHLTARLLDNKRLAKQRVEVLQVLKALYNLKNNIKSGWQNHPITKMWCGFENGLIHYGMVICDEWIFRGYKDTCKQKIEDYVYKFDGTNIIIYPEWINDNELLESHKCRLLQKNYNHYSEKIKSIDGKLPENWQNREYKWSKIG